MNLDGSLRVVAGSNAQLLVKIVPQKAQVASQPCRVSESNNVASDVIAGINKREFLILPPEQEQESYRPKGSDRERLLSGVRRYQKSLV